MAKRTWWFIRYMVENEQVWEESFYRSSDAESGDIIQEALDIHDMTWHDLKGEGSEDRCIEFFVQEGEKWRQGMHVVL